MIHTELEVWKRSMDFVIEIYSFTKQLPKSEEFGLMSQLRRASVSIPTNISEGAGRQYKKEFIQFLYIAQGSMSEIETLLVLCQRLHGSDISSLSRELTIIKKLLSGFIRHLKRDT
jgi:four helix bundle protein